MLARKEAPPMMPPEGPFELDYVASASRMYRRAAKRAERLHGPRGKRWRAESDWWLEVAAERFHAWEKTRGHLGPLDSSLILTA